MRLSFRLCALLLPAACADLGDRAATGECPVGEVCSPTTPQGLAFQGLVPTDLFLVGGMFPTAVGGAQEVTLYDGGSGAVFRRAFEPTSDAPGITATRAGTKVVLAAAAASNGLLRILAEDGTLHDRIGIASHEVARLELRAFEEQLEPGRPVALTPTASATLAVALVAADGTRLVDRDLRLDAPADTASGWDAVQLRDLTAPVTIAATTGSGLAATFTVRPATTVDSVVLQAHPALAVGAQETVCATALTGGAQLVGATWTWSASTSDVTVTPFEGIFRNCAAITPRRGGSLPVQVTANGRTATVQLEVGTGSARAAPTTTDGLGEVARAALLADVD